LGRTLAALGLVTPVPLVPAAKGPPHVGATGWLFHLDMPNIALLGMRPGRRGPTRWWRGCWRSARAGRTPSSAAPATRSGR
jgi:hypothetical protein